MRRVAVLLLCALAGSASAATIPVAPGAVVIADDDVCSLHEAFLSANEGTTHDDCVAGDAGADTIVLANRSSDDVADAHTPGNALPAVTSTIALVEERRR